MTDAASVQTDFSSDEVIVEGLLLEDRGEGAEEIEHWCIVTNDYFHISSHKGAPASISIPFSLIAEVERSQSLERLRALQRQYSPTESFLERTRIEGSFEEKSLKPDSASSSFFLLRTKPTMIHSLLRYGGQYKLEYKMVAQNEDVCNWWIEGISSAIQYHSRLPPDTPWQMFRKSVKMSYESDTFQIFVALCIFANFIAQAVEAQILPEHGTHTAQLFSLVEGIFLLIFCFELGTNMVATLFIHFFSNGWNYFDVVVIGTSVWSTFFGDGGAGTGVLRLLRAGKVIRLFTRLPSLRKILNALYESIPAMTNAMLLTGLVMCMYGVMGVSFFSEHDNFKSFDVAVFTLFQASTGDGWSDIVRDVYDDPHSDTFFNTLVSVYFVSYMIIVALILMQVVIAVLLEEFSKVSADEKQKAEDLRDHTGGTNFSFHPNPFEALAEDFMPLCRDEESLNAQIQLVYVAVAEECHQTEEDFLTFEQLNAGLKALKLRPPALLTRREWNRAVVERRLCDESGRIGREGFVDMVRQFMREHVLTEMTKSIKGLQHQGDEKAMLSLMYAMKMVLLEVPSHLVRTSPGVSEPATRTAAPSCNHVDRPEKEEASSRVGQIMQDFVSSMREAAVERRKTSSQLSGLAADVAAVAEEVAALRAQVSLIAPFAASKENALRGETADGNGAATLQHHYHRLPEASGVRSSVNSFLPDDSRPTSTSPQAGAGAAARLDAGFSWRNSLLGSGSSGREEPRHDSTAVGSRKDGEGASALSTGVRFGRPCARSTKNSIEPSPRKYTPLREDPCSRSVRIDDSGAQEKTAPITPETHEAGTAPEQIAGAAAASNDNEAAQITAQAAQQARDQAQQTVDEGECRARGIKDEGLGGGGNNTTSSLPPLTLNLGRSSAGKAGEPAGKGPAWHACVEEDEDTYADLMTSPRTDRSAYEV